MIRRHWFMLRNALANTQMLLKPRFDFRYNHVFAEFLDKFDTDSNRLSTSVIRASVVNGIYCQELYDRVIS